MSEEKVIGESHTEGQVDRAGHPIPRPVAGSVCKDDFIPPSLSDLFIMLEERIEKTVKDENAKTIALRKLQVAKDAVT